MAAVLPPERTDLGSRGLQLLRCPQTTASRPTKGGHVHLLRLTHHGAGSNSPDQKQICTTPSSACRATPTPPTGFPFFVGGALLASTFSQGRNYFSETNREGFWCLLWTKFPLVASWQNPASSLPHSPRAGSPGRQGCHQPRNWGAGGCLTLHSAPSLKAESVTLWFEHVVVSACCCSELGREQFRKSTRRKPPASMGRLMPRLSPAPCSPGRKALAFNSPLLRGCLCSWCL